MLPLQTINLMIILFSIKRMCKRMCNDLSEQFTVLTAAKPISSKIYVFFLFLFLIVALLLSYSLCCFYGCLNESILWFTANSFGAFNQTIPLNNFAFPSY